MTSSVPGRQSAIGLALLFFGPAIAFLFFYSPKKVEHSSNAATSSDSIYQKARASKLGANSLETHGSQALPSTSPTKWLMNESAKPALVSGHSTLSPQAIDDSADSDADTRLDSLLAGRFASQSTLPKDYSGTMVKLETPSKLLPETNGPSTTLTPATPSNGMVPLGNPGSQPAETLDPSSANRSQVARFGAGAYRPKVAPTNSADRFPKPTQVDNNLLSSEANSSLVPLQPRGAETGVSESMKGAPPTNSSAPTTPPLLSVAHPMQGDISRRNSLEPASRPNLMPPPLDENRQPQFVRQPKR